MNPYAVRMVSKDCASKPVTAILDFKTEKGRDEYWTAFWRNERGFTPLQWTAEKVNYTRYQLGMLNAKRS